jgi:hypothetical protein
MFAGVCAGRIAVPSTEQLSMEITERLRRGGDDGISVFMRLAAEIYKTDAQQGLTKWTLGAFKYLPKRDQEVLLATALEALVKTWK